MVSEDVPHPRMGGLGRHALALAHELHARGHEVDFLGNSVHPLAANAEQTGPGRFFADISGHERLFKEKQLGLFVPWRAQLNARHLAQAVLRHAAGYDVIHYHGHLPCVANGLPASLPFTQTRHDQGGDCMLNTRFRPALPPGEARCTETRPEACAGCATQAPNAVQRSVSRNAVQRMRTGTAAAYQRHPVIFVSEFLRQGFARVNGGTLRGEVIHNAIDTGALQHALKSPRASGDSRWPIEVFGAAALAPYKGFASFMRELVSQGLPADMRVTIAGEGAELAELQALALGPQLRLLGWCSQDAVLAATVQADVVIVPSVWDEPCATTVIEALGLHRTVFALNRGGNAELAPLAGPAGQRLKLFDSLAELVSGLRQFNPGHAPLPSAHDVDVFPGSVQTMANAVLAHYARHFGQHRMQARRLTATT